MSATVLAGAVVLFVAVLAAGFLLGWLVLSKVRRKGVDSARVTAQKIVSEAEVQAQALVKTTGLEVRDEWRREREPLERELEAAKRASRELAASLADREQQLDRKVDVLESKERLLVKSEQDISQRESAVAAEETRVQEMVLEQQERLQEVARITQAEARAELIQQLEDSARQFAARKVREIKDSAIANANREAKEIISRSIQRFAGELALEGTLTVVPLPSDEMKGRIIGRDGRNIRSFDMITGVEVIVDDTPGMVMLSSFDPLRREVAKNTLEKLIIDGRIHPGRIEEVFEKANADIEDIIRESGSKAAFDLGIHDLPQPLLKLLGKLCFHTSYGQNLLAHSVEVSLLAGAMAEELELDAGLARRAGLLHDIAKAVDHVIGGDETQTSASLARKDGESPEVVEVIETHSLELPTRSAVAVLVRAADEISTSRPGAHKERVEDYIRRMQQIEEIAGSHPGVTKAYSLQTGKEVRVLVDSATVDDAYADQLADEITEMLEDELAQPGQIKVCLIREVRAVHYAR